MAEMLATIAVEAPVAGTMATALTTTTMVMVRTMVELQAIWVRLATMMTITQAAAIIV